MKCFPARQKSTSRKAGAVWKTEAQKFWQVASSLVLGLRVLRGEYVEHLSTVSGHLHVHKSHMACQCLSVCVYVSVCLTQYPTFLLACHQRRPSHAFALIALGFSCYRVISRQLSLSSKVSSLRHEFNFVSRNCLVLFTHCINFRARFARRRRSKIGQHN